MLASALWLLLSTAAPTPPGPPAAPIERDDGGLDSKELLKRLDAMKEELKTRPKTAEIEFALGNLYYENARYPEAIDMYRQLVERSALPMARYLEARRHPHQLIDPLKANCVSGEHPTFDDLIAGADAKAASHDYSAAVACYDAALLPVLTARAHRANAFFLIGNEDRAIEEHRAILQIEPDYSDSLFFLGALLFETGNGAPDRLREARDAWKRYLAAGPDLDRAKIVHANLKRIDDALANGGRMAGSAAAGGAGPMMAAGPLQPPAPKPALDPEQAKALKASVAQGQRALEKRSWKAALAAFEQARELDPADEDAATGAGTALMELGRRMEAEAAFREALGRNPNNGFALYQLGEVFFQNRHYAGAARFWTQLLERDPAVAAKFNVKARIAEAQANAGG